MRPVLVRRLAWLALGFVLLLAVREQLFPREDRAAPEPPPPPGWTALGSSELHPRSQRLAYTWREAIVSEGEASDFEAAVDGQGRLLVATAESPSALGDRGLLVRRWGGQGWERLPPVATITDEVPGTWDESDRLALAVSSDPQDRPLLAWWTKAGGLQIVRYEGEAWEPLAAPAALEGEPTDLGLAWAEGPVLLRQDVDSEMRIRAGRLVRGAWAWETARWGQERPWSLVRTRAVGGRLAWAVLGRTEEEAAASRRPPWPQPRPTRVLWSWPPEPARRAGGLAIAEHLLADSADGWRWVRAEADAWGGFTSEPASGPGAPLHVTGFPLFTGVHMDGELNRWRVRQWVGGSWRALGPGGHPALAVPHRHSGRALAFATDPPLLVLAHEGESVAALRWTGETWWGLGGAPARGGVSDPEIPASRPRFVPGGDRPTVRWLERDDERGAVLAQSGWDGARWSEPLRRDADPAAADARCSRGGWPSRGWWWLEQDGRGALLLTALCGGVWDRVWGGRAEQTAVFLEGEGSLQPLRPLDSWDRVDAPVREACGEGFAGRCAVGALAALPGGGALVAIHLGADGWGDKRVEAEETWRLLRWEGGRWSQEPFLDAPAGDGSEPVALEGGEDPVFVLAGGTSAARTLRVFRRQARGWRAMRGGGEALGGLGSFSERTRAPPAASILPLSRGRLLLAWRVQGGVTSPNLAVAQWSGLGWSRQSAGLPAAATGEPALRLAPDGTPLLAWSDGHEAYAAWWDGGLWRGLAGSDREGGVSNSPAPSTDPDVWASAERVCVAWSEAGARQAQILVRCHPWPATDEPPGGWTILGEAEYGGRRSGDRDAP